MLVPGVIVQQVKQSLRLWGVRDSSPWSLLFVAFWMVTLPHPRRLPRPCASSSLFSTRASQTGHSIYPATNHQYVHSGNKKALEQDAYRPLFTVRRVSLTETSSGQTPLLEGIWDQGPRSTCWKEHGARQPDRKWHHTDTPLWTEWHMRVKHYLAPNFVCGW